MGPFFRRELPHRKRYRNLKPHTDSRGLTVKCITVIAGALGTYTRQDTVRWGMDEFRGSGGR
jgi:hypothetical protein